MDNPPALRSWGDAELDRLWLQLYRIELGMTDLDLATESAKLKKWEAVNQSFKERMAIVQRKKEAPNA